LNIAEGNGKHTPADRCRYFDIACGSAIALAIECAACPDVLAAKKKTDEDKVKKGKDQLYQVVAMLIGLIRANSKRNV
jgi:four helix bundle protein